MKKRDFETFIKGILKDLPLEKQEDILKKIQHKWLPDIQKKLSNRIKKNYFKCSKCGRYSLKKRFDIIYDQELVKGVTVYSDAGYGDDDKFADVTYSVEYLVCPICKGLTEKSRYPIAESNRRGRW